MTDRYIPCQHTVRAAGVAVLALTAGLVQADSGAADRKLAALGYSMAEIVEVVPDQIVQSWDYLDDRKVLVHRDTERHYLVTLTEPCPALQTASTIAFNAAIGGLGASSALRVGTSPTAPECQIGSLLRLDRKLRPGPETRSKPAASSSPAKPAPQPTEAKPTPLS